MSGNPYFSKIIWLACASVLQCSITNIEIKNIICYFKVPLLCFPTERTVARTVSSRLAQFGRHKNILWWCKCQNGFICSSDNDLATAHPTLSDTSSRKSERRKYPNIRTSCLRSTCFSGEVHSVLPEQQKGADKDEAWHEMSPHRLRIAIRLGTKSAVLGGF